MGGGGSARRWVTAGRAGACALLFLSSCSRVAAGEGTAPGVLVIAIDGLRADHVHAFGYDRPTTPTLDRLAEDGVLFSETFANSPSLLPSHVSLMTGCEPFVARRYLPAQTDASVERRWHVPDEVPRLAVEYLAHGYDTAAFVDHPHLAPVFGFATGFEEYAQSAGGERGASYLTMRLMQWLRDVDRDSPWFAYLHLHDLERSWSDPDPRWERFFTPRPGMDDVPPVGATDNVFFAVPYSRWRGGSRSLGELEAQYDGHIRRLDEALERLLGSLRATGRFEETTIAVVGSYGIQFGEAGMYLAGGRYSLADLHVPWILRPRAGLAMAQERGSIVDGLASLSDVAPTLLELSGLAVPHGTHGVSQAAWVRGPAPATPLRPYAFSSCGIQDGGVVLGPRMCYEFLLPGDAEHDLFRRSWFGKETEPEGRGQIRFYDRIAHPFPPLEAGLREGTPEEYDRFFETAVSWYEDMELVRRVLHATALFFDPVPPATVKRLQEEGLLVDQL